MGSPAKWLVEVGFHPGAAFGIGWRPGVRRRVSETSQFLAMRQAGQVITRPIPSLWANDRLGLIRGFALIAAGSVAFNTFFIFMPNQLAATAKLNLVPTLAISAAILGVTAAAAVALGRLSDVIGRRPVAIWSSVSLAVLAGPMAVLGSRSQLGLLIAQLIIGIALAGVLLACASLNSGQDACTYAAQTSPASGESAGAGPIFAGSCLAEPGRP